MARGYDAHRARQDARMALGRQLTRRSGAACELCEESGVKLTPREVTPVPESPDLEHAVFICERCHEGVEGGRVEPLDWRFLEASAWSEVAPVQVVAVRMVRRLAAEGVDWARDLNDMLYLAPEIEAWIDEAS